MEKRPVRPPDPTGSPYQPNLRTARPPERAASSYGLKVFVDGHFPHFKGKFATALLSVMMSFVEFHYVSLMHYPRHG
jgi:hypothetical protein